MQSKAPLFSKAIIYKNLQRFWPIFAAYTLFVSILSLGMVMNTNYERLILPGEFMNYVYSSTTTLSVVIALFSIAIAVGVFAYMHNTVPTAMVNALPYKRQTMFFSNYLSGLLMILIPLLLFFLILIGIGLNYNCLDILGLSKWLFIFTSLSVLLYSAAVTIGMLTGNIIAHIVFFGIANFFLIGIEALSQFFLGFFLYGYSAGLARSEMLMIKATPIVHTSLAAHTASIQTDWIVWLSYFLLGVLLTWLALKLYKNRKMENAGDVIAIRKLNPIFKYGITFCTSLALGMILIGVFNIQSNSFLLPVLLLLFAGMVGYFIAEMLLRKSYRVIGTYKGFIIYALLFTLVSMSFYSDWYGYANRLPDANKVQAVAFSDSNLSHNTINNLQAEKSRVYLGDIPNLPDSLALTYGEPIGKEDYLGPDSGYRYIYPDEENLTKEETKLLWSVIPGIYCEDESLATITELHEYLAKNIKTIRNNYRMRGTVQNYEREENHYYTISFIYKLDNGKVQIHNFPVIIPKQISEGVDQEIMQHLTSIAGSEERRDKKIAVIDLDIENIRRINVDIHNMRIYDQFLAEDIQVPVTHEKGDPNIEIKDEDKKGLIEAIKTDYLTMSDEEMLDSSRNYGGNIDFSIDNLDLPPTNKFREINTNIDLDISQKNTLDFLKDKGYMDEELYDYIQAYSKSA